MKPMEFYVNSEDNNKTQEIMLLDMYIEDANPFMSSRLVIDFVQEVTKYIVLVTTFINISKFMQAKA